MNLKIVVYSSINITICIIEEIWVFIIKLQNEFILILFSPFKPCLTLMSSIDELRPSISNDIGLPNLQLSGDSATQQNYKLTSKSYQF